MNVPERHRRVAHAWVDGAKVEGRNPNSTYCLLKEWMVCGHPAWEADWEYRIKSTPRLEWSKTLVEGKRVTFADAEKAVAELGDGWRLPTRQELESIQDLSRHNPCIDTTEFPDTESETYWSATPCAWGTSARWVVNFGGGGVLDFCVYDDACVRAVREGAAQAEQSVPVVGEWPHTMDAQVWARKWLEITADKPEVATDEGAMIGWFANAIMAGYDTAIAAEGEK